MIENSLPYVFVREIVYPSTKGFGSIVLTLDGESAMNDYVEGVSINGQVTVQVKDKSLDGLTSEFVINFQIQSDAVRDEDDEELENGFSFEGGSL